MTLTTREGSVFNKQLGENEVLISRMTLDVVYPTEEMYINYKRCHIIDKIRINLMHDLQNRKRPATSVTQVSRNCFIPTSMFWHSTESVLGMCDPEFKTTMIPLNESNYLLLGVTSQKACNFQQ
jgi:hypothetical protein